MTWRALSISPYKTVPFSRQLKGHAADVLCIAQAPPSVLATGDFDGVVILWNVESGAVRQGLVDVARRVIHRTLNPRLLI